MARPKNTRTTKWLQWTPTWCESRAEAKRYAKISNYVPVIEHRPNAKTQWGNKRRNTFVVLHFYPKTYRGRKVTAMPFRTKAAALRTRKYHVGDDLVKIRAGRWVFLGERVTHAKRKSARARKR